MANAWGWPAQGSPEALLSAASRAQRPVREARSVRWELPMADKAAALCRQCGPTLNLY